MMDYWLLVSNHADLFAAEIMCKGCSFKYVCVQLPEKCADERIVNDTQGTT